MRDFRKNPITQEESDWADKKENEYRERLYQEALAEGREMRLRGQPPHGTGSGSKAGRRGTTPKKHYDLSNIKSTPSAKVYKVLVDDNFDYADVDRRYEHGSYSSLEEALSAAKMLVDSYLISAHGPRMTKEELYESYTSFGPDPFISSNTEEGIKFSAWDYAKERCQEVCKCSMGTLENAIALATSAHEGQTDKAGAPYITHPLRVMSKLITDEEKITAVLHDTVEDCEWVTLDVLRAEGFSETVIEAVDSVTKREGEDYDAFVRRAAANPIGRLVKLADLEDNCDLSRMPNPTDRDYERIKKYRRAIEIIKGMDTADEEQSTPKPDQAGTGQRKRFDPSNVKSTPEDDPVYSLGFVLGESVQSRLRRLTGGKKGTPPPKAEKTPE